MGTQHERIQRIVAGALTIVVCVLGTVGCAPKPLIATARGCCIGMSCLLARSRPARPPDLTGLREGAYKITLSVVGGLKAGQSTEGTLWLKEASAFDRSGRSGERVNRKLRHKVPFYGAIEFDHDAIAANICPGYSKHSDGWWSPWGKRARTIRCGDPHPASCDPVYPGVLVAVEDGWAHLTVSKASNFRARQTTYVENGFDIWVHKTDDDGIYGIWNISLAPEHNGYFCARRINDVGLAGGPCVAQDSRSTNRRRWSPPRPPRPWCSYKADDIERRVMSRLTPDERETFSRRSFEELVNLPFFNRKYLRDRYGIDGTCSFVELIFLTVRGLLIRRLVCHVRLRGSIQINYAGFHKLRMGGVLASLRRQIDDQIARLPATSSGCDNLLTLRVANNPDLSCWARADSSGLTGPKSGSLTDVLTWLSSRNGFEIRNDPPVVELRFQNR